MSQLFTSRFWYAAAERALKTFAQALVALIGANAVAITELDWPQLLSVAGTAAVVSLLTSVASVGIGNQGPSLADETTVAALGTGPDDHTALHAGEPINPDEVI